MTITLTQDVPDPEGTSPPLKAGVPYEVMDSFHWAGREWYVIKDEQGVLRNVDGNTTLQEFKM